MFKCPKNSIHLDNLVSLQWKWLWRMKWRSWIYSYHICSCGRYFAYMELNRCIIKISGRPTHGYSLLSESGLCLWKIVFFSKIITIGDQNLEYCPVRTIGFVYSLMIIMRKRLRVVLNGMLATSYKLARISRLQPHTNL